MFRDRGVERLLEERDLRYQQRFDAQKEALQAAFKAAEDKSEASRIASEKAIIKAEAAADKRFDGLNELRGVVNDVSALQMPRREAEERIGSLDLRLNERIDALASRVGKNELDIKASAGRGAGLQAGWGYLVGIIGIISAVAAVVSRGLG